ncbi:MAG: penicillin-binding protein 2 [Anaerolineales bacterium]|nr:penicillin-binding protein 2 [Anaerolineales bacterium]
MNMNQLSIRRIQVVFGLMLAFVLAIVAQLIRVQYGPYAPIFAKRVEVSENLADEITPIRGLIYDRDGDLLATNAPMYYVEVEIIQLTDTSRREIAGVLSQILNLPFDDLRNQLETDWEGAEQYRIRLRRTTENGSNWPIIVDQVVADMLNGFLADPDAPDLSGLDLEPAPQRSYPVGTLMGHVLGFVNQLGEGFFGIEGFYDDWLTGQAITVENGAIPLQASLLPDTPAGVNLVLTIDLDIQQMVTNILAEAIEDSGAESGQVIVMDPRNGEILAMTTLPQLDSNDYAPWLPEDNVEEEPVINPIVAGQFEPGSTFKVLTMAAALDSGVVEADDVFVDNGMIEVGGVQIRNWNNGRWGPQTMTGCLQHSLNVCLANIAVNKLHAPLFYDYMEAFGMGQLTGIDLAGEVAGQMRTPRHPEWTDADLGTNSFGQGISVTPIQLVTAVAAIANDGVMVQPHVVRTVVGPEGEYWPQTIILGQPISAEAAHTLTAMLNESLNGETNFAQVSGYQLAGKTGTAQIPGEFGYDPTWTIASFIGWGPVSDPRFIVFVRIDRPETSPWGSVIAAPVFRDIVERLVVMLEIPPDDLPQQLAVEQSE